MLEGIGEREQILEHGWKEVIVGFDDGDVVPRSKLDPTIACGAVPLVFLVDDADAGIGGGVALHDGKGIVGRSVVEADDLHIARRLILDAFQTLVEKSGDVADGNDYRYTGSVRIGHAISP